MSSSQVDDEMEQLKQNDTLKKLLLRLEDNNNDGEKIYPITEQNSYKPILQKKIALSTGEMFTLDFYRNVAVFSSTLPQVKRPSKYKIIKFYYL